MNRHFLILIVALTGTLFVTSAQAATRYFCASSGDWDVATNWDSNALCTNGADGVPTAADRAIIQSGKTCNIDSAAEADTLDVENTATLNIEAASGNSLTLDGDNDAGISTIAGTLNLQGSNSLLAFTTNDQTIDGAGKIVGQHGSAQITISDGETLTNDTTIEGALKIKDATSNATFLNHGIVHANVAGTLEISTDAFDDDSTALWKISTNSDAVLLLDSAGFDALEGDFEIFGNGRLDVDYIGFRTTGSLDWRGGTIDVGFSSSVDFSN